MGAKGRSAMRCSDGLPVSRGLTVRGVNRVAARRSGWTGSRERSHTGALAVTLSRTGREPVGEAIREETFLCELIGARLPYVLAEWVE